jgi:hypothetical protein
MTRGHLLRTWVACAALLVLGASGAAGDDDKKDKDHQDKNKLRGTYTYRLVPATSFAPFQPASGVATAPRQDILRVGVFTADGAGNLKGRAIATTDDGLTTVKIDFNWTGTYTLDTQGLGEMLINAPALVDINSCVDGTITLVVPVANCHLFEGAERYAFVLNPHGDDKLVNMIQTDNEGGGAKIFLTGEAKRR